MDTSHFYSNLESVDDFKEISNTSLYQELPDDWFLFLTDVKGSTKAIESGRYKEVNMLGALSIVTLINLDKSIELPFVFGGDGAFVLIPSRLLEQAKQAYLSLEKLARDTYDLELRIGCIALTDIKKSSYTLLIAKYEVSKHYYQAIIKGGGLDYADTLLKTDESHRIRGNIDPHFTLNIDGLECRWESIPSPKDKTISLLIKCMEDSYYKNVLNHLDSLLGSNKTRHPIAEHNLNLSFNSNTLRTESALYGKSAFMKYLTTLKFKVINLLGSTLMRFKVAKWGGYKDGIIATTDTEKFDDILRMVISLTHEQVEALENYLESEFLANTLVYGIHKADSALMTCLVFERHGNQIHFVDSSDGGYAVAAKMMKKKGLYKND